MIRKLKITSIKLPSKTILICMMIIIISLGNGLMAKGTEINIASSNVISNDKVNENDFIIDPPIKFYENIKKTEKIANIKFKVPDFLPDEGKVNGFEIIKLSDKDNAVGVLFEGSESNFSFLVSASDPVETLKKIENNRTKAIGNIKVDGQKQPLKLGDINGLNVTIITTLPARKIGDKYLKESQKVSNYYIWKNEGLWYSLEYNSTSKSEENSNILVNISKEDIINIIKSLNYPEKVKNLDYSLFRNASTGISALNIYDMEDLEKAKTLLDFNPKFPLNIGEDIKITGAIVGISKECNKKDDISEYKLNNFYSNKDGSIIFTEQKKSNIYEELSKNGLMSYKEDNAIQQIKAEKLNISNNQVFKYLSEGCIPQVNYVWRENDIYYSLNIFINILNSDEIAKSFIDSKSI
ncbi:hypothetical protein CDLVIII_3237 [Clostridium sp. DL-VIII]|uniref:hypothetical protein n=1 Tax=Clostridium sp. DL-VIII TaxID=641107 RepID=UPI00023B0061|nr:hypothetical protein [Clostridium sp. DL-VIII]EHI99810.1 hypothetical protein CDLVIII_3237 [Clostridium sp. DL-VIII]